MSAYQSVTFSINIVFRLTWQHTRRINLVTQSWSGMPG